MGGASSDNHGEAVDYEVPENIKTLHHLALQYVNQVRHISPMNHTVHDDTAAVLQHNPHNVGLGFSEAQTLTVNSANYY